MSTPPGDPNDPHQQPGNQPGNQPGEQPPTGGQPHGYGQPQGYGQQPPPPPYGQPADPYASYPPPYAPPVQGGYNQQPENHPKATTALVLGIVGVLCCSLTAPFAWVIGKRTMDEIDSSAGRVGGRGVAQAGYILGIVGTLLLVLSLLGLVFVVAVGSFTFDVNTNS